MSRKIKIPKDGKLPPLTQLKQLPADKRIEIREMLEAVPREEAQKNLEKQFGIRIGRNGLSVFWQWQKQQERTENYNQLIEGFEDFYTKANPNASREKVRDAGIAFFLAETTANRDREGFTDVARLDLKERDSKTNAALEERKVSVSERRIAMLERKIMDAAKALEAAKSSGGITPETYELMEKKLKLL